MSRPVPSALRKEFTAVIEILMLQPQDPVRKGLSMNWPRFTDLVHRIGELAGMPKRWTAGVRLTRRDVKRMEKLLEVLVDLGHVEMLWAGDFLEALDEALEA